MEKDESAVTVSNVEGCATESRLSSSDVEEGTKVGHDGNTVLIPTPTNDPNDPLNWKETKKRIILGVIAYIAFLPDFGSSAGLPAFIPQAQLWDQPLNVIQRSEVAALIGLGVGSIFFVVFASAFGRLPVLFICQLISTAAGIWAAVATSFASFVASRAINGFFGVTAAAGGLLWIQDLFFFHQHPRAINIWSAAVVGSPYIGPLVASFVTSGTTWRWIFWIYTILNFIALGLIVLFMDETIYPRSASEQQQNVASEQRKSRLMRFLGFEQWRTRKTRPSFVEIAVRPLIAITKIPVFALVCFIFLNFSWVIGVNATASIWLAQFYDFNEKDSGLFYLAGVAGCFIGWFIGHWLHDYIGELYARRHSGLIAPEARLIITWPSALLLVFTPPLVGACLQNHWSYYGLAVLFGTQIAGIMMTNTGVEAYLLDAYPEGAGDVGALTHLGRTMGGCMATYVQINWVTQSGPETVLGIQAGIAAASMFIVIGLQIWGAKMRKWQGPMKLAKL